MSVCWYTLNRDGSLNGPVSLAAHARWMVAAGFGTGDYLLREDHCGDFAVRSVFLGGTSRTDGQDRPLLFTTEVIGGGWHAWSQRHASRAGALATHEGVVAALKAGTSPDSVLDDYPRQEVA